MNTLLIICLLIGIFVPPVLVILWIIKKITADYTKIFQEYKKDQVLMKKVQETDASVVCHAGAEYHQYSFFRNFDESIWENTEMKNFSISREKKDQKIRSTQISLHIPEPRYRTSSIIFISEQRTNTQKKLILLQYIIFVCAISISSISLLLIFPIISTFDTKPEWGNEFILINIALLVYSILGEIRGNHISNHYNILQVYKRLSQQSMESLGFEKSFDAFSKDPVEARMIITPAFMDRLEEFSEKWNLKGKIRIIWEKDTFTLLLKGDIEQYGKESDGSYTLVKSMEEMLNLGYYSFPQTNTNNS